MSYTVFWREEPSTYLLAQLLRANDKPGTFAAAREIERLLSREPHVEGESRTDPFRLLFIRPFSVLYHVDEESKTVEIDQIKWVGQ